MTTTNDERKVFIGWLYMVLLRSAAVFTVDEDGYFPCDLNGVKNFGDNDPATVAKVA